MLFTFLNEEQNETIKKSLDEYRGHVPTLEAAIGAIFVGHRYGWRVLKIVHSPATYRKYEKILGIKFQDICPERGELAHRSLGLAIADKLNSFWAVATGKKKIKEKATLADEDDIAKELKNVD